MGKHFFDYDDGNFAHTISDNMAIDSDGDLLMRMGDNMAIDTLRETSWFLPLSRTGQPQ